MKALFKANLWCVVGLMLAACSSEPKSVEYYQKNPDKRLAKLAECEAKLRPIDEQLAQKTLELGEKLLKGEINEEQAQRSIESDYIEALGGEKEFKECQNAEDAN